MPGESLAISGPTGQSGISGAAAASSVSGMVSAGDNTSQVISSTGLGVIPGPNPTTGPVVSAGVAQPVGQGIDVNAPNGKPRQGLNGAFSYMLPNTNKAQVYQVRVLALGYGVQQLQSETMSRTRRAFYPRNVVAANFNIQLLLVGVSERASFSNYIQSYVTNYLSPQSSFPPIMTFTCTSMNISQTGIPIQGFEWGNSVGAMVWTPTIVMQPTDATFAPVGVQRTGGTGISNLDMLDYANVIKQSPEVKYFYPQGTQLTGDQAPPDGSWVAGAVLPLAASIIDSVAQGIGKGLGGK